MRLLIIKTGVLAEMTISGLQLFWWKYGLGFYPPRRQKWQRRVSGGRFEKAFNGMSNGVMQKSAAALQG